MSKPTGDAPSHTKTNPDEATIIGRTEHTDVPCTVGCLQADPKRGPYGPPRPRIVFMAEM